MKLNKYNQKSLNRETIIINQNYIVFSTVGFTSSDRLVIPYLSSRIITSYAYMIGFPV
jgi:hypothetical protein